MAETEIPTEPSRAFRILKAVGATAKVSPRRSIRPFPADIRGEQRSEAVLELATSNAAKILGSDAKVALDPTGDLTDLGFDSLAAVELRNELWLEIGAKVPIEMIRRSPTLRESSDWVLSVAEESGRETPTSQPLRLPGEH